MRKLTEDDSLIAVLEVTEVPNATLNWHFDSRVLVKLP